MSVINVIEVLVALAVIYATYWFFPEAGMTTPTFLSAILAATPG